MTGNATDVLLSCAGSNLENRPALTLKDAADWPVLLEAAEFHGLVPLLYWLIGRGASPIAPRDIARRLHQDYLDAARRSLFLTASLKQLLSRFAAARIPVIPLKGPALAESLYPDPALRSSFDLDLLIRPADFGASQALLSREGYALAPYLARLSQPTLFGLDCVASFSHQNGLRVELHWRTTTDDYPFRFDAEVLWRSQQLARLAGQEIAVLAPECLLLYLCVHGTKHAWSRLHWLGDLARLVDKGVGWNAVLRLTLETQCERPVFVGLLLAHELLGSCVPDEIIERARADRVILSAVRETEERLRRLPPSEPSSTARTAYGARLAPRTRDKIRHWAEMFKAPKGDELERWNLPRWLFFLYYPLRIERLARKYARNRRDQRS
jgi:hypothetical protein